MKRVGVLLVNLGTPRSAEVADVARYLREFLSDPDVIDLPLPLRWILVNMIIVPRRSPNSAEAYKQIWTPAGSPLLVHSQKLADKLAQQLNSLTSQYAGSSAPVVAADEPIQYSVNIAMRYGEPAMGRVLKEIYKPLDQLLIIPLYPQFAQATTGSTLREVNRQLRRLPRLPQIQILGAFYDHPQFLRALSEVAAESLASHQVDHYLFSFHGLPERQIRKSDRRAQHCLKRTNCCAQIQEVNSHCYRAQCYATARGLAGQMNLQPEQWSVSFQSRLGRAKWITPYTEETLIQLARSKKKRLAVLCPGFVSDCLETLEEIGLRMRDEFLSAGGHEFHLLPCLNSHDSWVAALSQIIQDRQLSST